MAPVEEVPDSTSSKEGSSKRLECQVIGMPRPSVRWYKDGVNITTQSRYKFEYTVDGFAVLILENVTDADKGVYVCLAQNSEGSAETSAQLFIKGKMSAYDNESSSVHKMTSFKKVETREVMTSQSQRRPLRVGKSLSEDEDNLSGEKHEILSPEIRIEKDKKLYDKYDLLETEAKEEKGALENGTEKANIAQRITTVVYEEKVTAGGDVRLIEDFSQHEEIFNSVDDILENTKFGSSGRRLTTDSGITSRGSSFSSEPDINIKEESIKEIKEYLHGKADALYQQLEQDKVKEIKNTETQYITSKSESSGIKRRSESSKIQAMSMTSLEKENIDFDRVNEMDARLLAGKYLFDRGPKHEVLSSRHHVPELEILMRKQALDDVAYDETSSQVVNGDIKEHSNDMVEQTKANIEFQTTEITNSLQMTDGHTVEKLNEINIEKSRGERQIGSEHLKSSSNDNRTHIEESSSIVQQSRLQSLSDVQENQFKDGKTTDSQSEKSDDYDKICRMQNDLAGEQSDKEHSDVCDINTSKSQTQDKPSGLEKVGTGSVNQDKLNKQDQSKSIDEPDSKGIRSKKSGDSEKVCESGEHVIEDVVEAKMKSMENESILSFERSKDNDQSDKNDPYGRKTCDSDEIGKRKAESDSEYIEDITEITVKSEPSKSEISQLQDKQNVSKEEENAKSYTDQGPVSKKIKEKGKLVTYSDEMEENEFKNTRQINEELSLQEASLESVQSSVEIVETTDKYRKELKLYSAHQGDDDGVRCVQPLDERLEGIDDTQPVISNIINVMPNLKQNKLRVEDASLSDELEKRGLTTKCITDDSYAVTSVSNIVEAGGIFAVAPAEIKMTTSLMASNGEPMVAESVSTSEGAMESVEKETGEKIISDKDDNKKYTPEKEIVEADITSKSAKTDENVPDLDQVDQVEQKITIMLEGSDINVVKGQSFILKWKISGASWSIANIYKNGEKVKSSSNLKIKIIDDVCVVSVENASLGDAAVYTVGLPYIGNNLGKVTVTVSETKSEQKDKPVNVLVENNKVNINEGETFELIWKIEGTSWSSASICKDGQKVTASDKLSIEVIEDVCSLTVCKSLLSDAGIYSVKLSEKTQTFGVISVSVATDNKKKEAVKPSIEIVTDNENVDVKEGESFQVKWKMIGTSWSTASIYKDGKKIKATDKLTIKVAEDVCTLHVDKSRVSDGGVYSVKLSEEDETFSVVKVTVSTDSRKEGQQTEPCIEILTDNNHVNASEGEFFQLKWKISGMPWSSTSITKNGKKISLGGNVTIDTDGDVCTLSVDKASVNDAAMYGVCLSNSESVLGNITVSVESELSKSGDKIEPKVDVLTDSESVNISEGETFQLKWKVTGESWSSASITKDGKKVESGDNVTIDVDGDICTLCVDKATLDDGATYGVNFPNVESVLGSVTMSVSSEQSKQDKKFEPKVDVLVDNITVAEGETATLKWKISGSRFSAQNIYKNDKRLEADNNIQIDITDDVCTICIDKATTTDSAVYSVKLDQTKQGKITVKVTTDEQSTKTSGKDDDDVLEPVVYALMDNRNIDVKEGESFNLRWKITGADWSAASVYKDGAKVSFSDDGLQVQILDDVCTLRVASAGQSDTAIYSVKLDNSDQNQGEIFVDVITEERSKPTEESLEPTAYVLTDNRNIQTKEGQSFQIKWKLTGTDWTNVGVYKNSDRLKPSDNIHINISDGVCTLVVDEAKIADAADYSIRMNKAGQDQGEVNVNVSTSVDEKSKTDKKKKSPTEESIPTADVAVDETNYNITEGESLSLKWKLSGSQWSNANLYKDGKKLEAFVGQELEVLDDTCVLVIDNACVKDAAVYSVRMGDSTADQGEINVTVTSSTELTSAPDLDSKVTTDKDTKINQAPTVDVAVDNSSLTFDEGDTMTLKWTLSGSQWSNANLYKDGKKLEAFVGQKLEVLDDTCVLVIDNACVKDAAVYSVRMGDSTVDQGEINVTVTSSTEQTSSSDKGAKVAVDDGMSGKQEPTIDVKVDSSSYAEDAGKMVALTVESDVDSSSGIKDTEKSQAITVDSDIDSSSGTKDEVKNQELTVDSDIGTSSLTKDKKVGQGLIVDADVESKTQSKDEVDGIAIGVDSDIDSSSRTKVEGEGQALIVEVDESSCNVEEGEAVTLKWKLSGSQWSDVCIYKDGKKLEAFVGQTLEVQDETCVLVIDNACMKDSAVYSVRPADSTVEFGAINVTVASSTEQTSDDKSDKDQIPCEEDVMTKDEVMKIEVGKSDEVDEEPMKKDQVKTDELSRKDDVQKDEPSKKKDIKLDETMDEVMTAIRNEEVKVTTDEPSKDKVKSNKPSSKDEVTTIDEPSKKDMAKTDEPFKDKFTTDELSKLDEIKKDKPLIKDDVKKDEPSKDEVKTLKKDKVKEDETSKKDEVKEDEVTKVDVLKKDAEKKEDEIKKDKPRKKDEIRTDEPSKTHEDMRDEPSKDKVSTDKTPKDEVKKDVLSKEEDVKKDEPSKDKVTGDEPLKDIFTTDELSNMDKVKTDEPSKKDKVKGDKPSEKDEVKEDDMTKVEVSNKDAEKKDLKKEEHKSDKKDEVETDEPSKKDEVKRNEPSKDKIPTDEPSKKDEVMTDVGLKDEITKVEVSKKDAKMKDVKKDEIEKGDLKKVKPDKKDKIEKDESCVKDEVKENKITKDKVSEKDAEKKDGMEVTSETLDKPKIDEPNKDKVEQDRTSKDEIKTDEPSKKNEVKKDEPSKKQKVEKDEPLVKVEVTKDKVSKKKGEPEMKDKLKKDEPEKKEEVKKDEPSKDKVKRDIPSEKDEIKEDEIKKDKASKRDTEKKEVDKKYVKKEPENEDVDKVDVPDMKDTMKKDEPEEKENIKKDDLIKTDRYKTGEPLQKDKIKKDEVQEDEVKTVEAAKKDKLKGAKKDAIEIDDLKKHQMPSDDKQKIHISLEETSEVHADVLIADKNVIGTVGEPFQVQWKIDGTLSGSTSQSVNIYKDGNKVSTDENVHVDIKENMCILSVNKASLSDSGNYSVRLHENGYDQGEINVDIALRTDEDSSENEPRFITEPAIDVKDGRRLSIKCAVTGFPAPEVIWYHEGQALTPSALWDIYTQDGYHYLAASNSADLLSQEIVCRVENDNGYVQKVVKVKQDGDEVYCETVLPPVNIEPLGEIDLPPYIHLEISEVNTDNLRKVTMLEEYTDSFNVVTMEADSVVDVIACVDDDSILARNHPAHDKVCYIPKQSVASSGDVSRTVCESGNLNASVTQEHKDTHSSDLREKKRSPRGDIPDDTNMPERRKLKSPSPKMTSTPKMKRREPEETEKELQKRLGFSESPNSRKEFSSPGDSVELTTEYNDGTTRPMFKKRLKSVTAKTGEMAQLECQVSGNPLPKILWLKNNRPLKAADGCKVIVDDSTNILVFPQARDEDAGIYTARAMNVNGSIMCSAEFSLSDGEGQAAVPSADSPLDLDFTTPAYFFQMSSCEVSEGRLARFDCRVVAYPRPEIVWMRDGKVIDVDVRFKLLNFNNEIYSLLIQDVRIEDTGRYTCWARNKFGEAMTEAYLNVKVLSDDEDDGDLAPKFLTRFYDQQTTEGTMTGFKCLIAGRPEPSVTWLLDDIEIHDSPGIRLKHKDGMVSLEIKSPKVEQSGNYTCQLSNTVGEATCSAKLTVVEDKLHGRMLPKFLKKFDHITGKEGEEARFSAVIVGEPRPDVIWLYDHKPISDSNRRFVAKQDGDAYTLIIKNLRFDDAGKITCKAVNSEGEVYCSANLNVRDSKFIRDAQDKIGMKDETDAKFGYIPTFTKRLQDIEVKEGSRATFECRVMGIPDPEISWMKDGRVITPGGRFRMEYENGTGQLVIENVSPTDTGVYTCIISNSQGKSSSTAALKLEDTTKKDSYKPEKKEDRLSRKDHYSPEKYVLDEIKPSKRPYLDTDKYDVTPKKSYDRSMPSLDDSFTARTRYDTHESPKRAYSTYSAPLESYKPYEAPYDTTKPSYESPVSQYDSYKPKYESPVSQYESYKPKYESPVSQIESYKPKYESPVSQYESYKPKYESPVRQFESYKPKYESPTRPYETYEPKYESKPYEPYIPRVETSRRPYDSGTARYESPVRQYEAQRPLYESPRRPEEPIKVVPKMPHDRPSLFGKEDESVSLSWLPASIYSLPEGARHVSYIIESREVPGQSWKKIASSVIGTNYTARNLDPEKEYEFRVRAQNQHGMSEPTGNAVLDRRVDDKLSKQVAIPEVRAPPRLPSHRPIITDLGEETVRLAWKPVDTTPAKLVPPVSYRLEAKELPGKDWMPMSDRLRDTSHYLSHLGTDRDYMIRVRAENDYGVSEPTEPLWLPRAKTFPGVPITRPKIIDYEETRAKLSWSRVDIPTFGLDDSPLLYMLEVEEPPYKDWRTLARDLDDTEYIVDGLRPGHDYRFRIRAKTPTGDISEPSPAVSLFTTLAQGRSPVDRLQMVDYEPDTRSLQLSWDRVHIPPYNLDEEPLMYMIEYQEPPMPDWKPLVTGIPTTRYRVMHLDAQRDYNFRVRALTSYGVSPPSPALPVTMRQPTAARGLPEAVVISEVQPDSLKLTWRRPMYDLDRPITYQVEMLEPPFSDWRPIASNVVDTSYRVTGLKPTKDYQFRVIPQVGSGYLAPTPSAALTMLPVRPRLPMGEPKLKELTPESVQLSWKPAEVPVYQRKHQPIYYKVEMLELPTNTWVPVARKLTSPSYNMTGLRPDLEYKFRVFAETDGGLSEPSMPAVLHRKPVPIFSTKMPTIKDISQNVVYLSWLPAEVPDSATPVSYMIEMQSPPGIAPWRPLYANHPAPSVRIADLRPDLDYMVRVRVQSGNYLSEPTLPVYIARRAAPPRMPQEEPYAVDISSDYVKLQWRSADIPSHIMDYAPITYRLEAQELPDTTWITIQQHIPRTDFKVTGLNPKRDYAFRVRAENEFGLSDPTQPMVLHKRSVAPSLPQDEPMLFDVGAGSCRLAWRPATLPSFAPALSPITYTLFVQEYPYKTWRPLVKRIPHTSYYVTGLQPDKEYEFRIQAENEFGTSKPTSAVRLPKHSDFTRPVSMPEVSDFDDDLTSVKLRWKPTRASPYTDRKPGKYTVETWEPIRREWKSVAHGVPDTTYHVRDLPKLPDHLFRVRMETENQLSEPSMPVSISRYSLPKVPIYRPQLYEVDNDTVRLSWQPVHVPEGVSRRSIRYVIEQREIPETRWFPVASDVTDSSYKIRGLRPKSDYEFRVKAVVDGTSTEPSFPVSLFRRPVIPKVKFDAPEIYDIDDTSLSLKWNTVDVPAFTRDDEPLMFVIERQTLPGYEWQPVASNITDRSYTVKDLKPYEDYNFRVRGVYPSGYSDPSPYVPVYRRPSESRIDVESRSNNQISQKYSYKLPSPLPTYSLHATTPTKLKKSFDKTRAFSSPPSRRFSLANIYEVREPYYTTEAEFEKVAVPEPKFKKENAYVYKKNRTSSVPLPDFQTPVYEPLKVPEQKPKSDKGHDLYAWYKAHRRFSEAGLEDRRHSRRSDYLEEQYVLERKKELMLESQLARMRRSSLPSAPHPVVGKSDAIPKYPSVADRYEDIKCPFIIDPGHWKFAKRHSVSLDWEDLQKLRLHLRAQSAKLSTKPKPRAKSEVNKSPTPSLISQSQDEYFGGTYFKVEDEVKFNDMRPVFAHSDLTAPMYRRSLSQERDPGYFVISKFSLAIAGVKKTKPSKRATSSAPRERYVRPVSLEPSPYIRKSYSPEPKPWMKTRSLTPDLNELKAKPYNADFHDIKERVMRRSDSLAKDLAKSRIQSSSYRSTARPSVDLSSMPRSSVRRSSISIPRLSMPRSSLPSSSVPRASVPSTSVPRTSVPSTSMPRASVSRSPVRQISPTRKPQSYERPRSYSVSAPRPDGKFNRNIAESKSLITNYERLDVRSRRSSIAQVSDDVMIGRSGSIADIKSDARFTSTPRGSTSEVKTDRRYSTSHRPSVSMTNTEQARLAATIAGVKRDPRYSTQRRATIASGVNSDLQSKLTSISNNLKTTTTPKPVKKSRPVMKFKSSRGDGVVA